MSALRICFKFQKLGHSILTFCVCGEGRDTQVYAREVSMTIYSETYHLRPMSFTTPCNM